MDLPGYTTVFNFIIGLIGVLSLVWGGWLLCRKRWKAWRKRYADILSAIESVPGLCTQVAGLADIKTQITMISKQVYPNGGSSMPDALARMEENQARNAAENAQQGIQLKELAKQFATMSNTMRAQANTNPRLGTFEADVNGRFIYANKTYLRWSGMQMVEALGWGWINAVVPAQQQRVRAEWSQAVLDCRSVTIKYSMIDVDGAVFEVEATATPIPEGVVPCDKWVGTIYQLEQHP